MKIGTSRIGTGRIGILSGSYDELSLTTNANLLGKLLASISTNANLINLSFLELTTNAEIIDYYVRQLTTNCCLIGTSDIALPTNAYLAELIVLDLPTNANLAERIIASITSNASLLAMIDLALTTNASLNGEAIRSITTNAYLAAWMDAELLTNAYLSEYVDLDITTNASLSAERSNSVTTSAYLVDIRYWALGPAGNLINMSGKVYDPEFRGFGVKTRQNRLPGARRVNVSDEGLEGGEVSFTVVFRSDSERHDFQEQINNDSENLILHVGRSDRYFYVKKVTVEPGLDELWKGAATLEITCYMEDPYKYHTIDQGLDLGACPLPQSGTSKYNYGSAEAPFLFKIGGFYSGGLQLTLPYVKCIDGATTEKSLALGPGLLSREYAELTLEGSQKYYLEHTYVDLYDTNNFWQYDAVQSGCSLANSQVSVPSGAWFYYKFQGYPLRENIRLTAKIVKTGSPIIQYSTNGTTWYTAIAASEIESGVLKEYWLTGTEKRSTVYVRFYSPVGSSMLVQDIVQFYMQRDISGEYDQIPSIPAGETRVLQVTGSGSTKARIQTTFKSRWQPA